MTCWWAAGPAAASAIALLAGCGLTLDYDPQISNVTRGDAAVPDGSARDGASRDASALDGAARDARVRDAATDGPVPDAPASDAGSGDASALDGGLPPGCMMDSDCGICGVCDGPSRTCVPVSETRPCRPAAGPCDVMDVCEFTSLECPDLVRAAGDPCRPSAGMCDVAERCDGILRSCPTDEVLPAGTPCASGTCDGLQPGCGRMVVSGGCMPSSGSCTNDFQCTRRGCAMELCSSLSAGTMCVCTTPVGVSCGCVLGQCEWYR